MVHDDNAVGGEESLRLGRPFDGTPVRPEIDLHALGAPVTGADLPLRPHAVIDLLDMRAEELELQSLGGSIAAEALAKVSQAHGERIGEVHVEADGVKLPALLVDPVKIAASPLRVADEVGDRARLVGAVQPGGALGRGEGVREGAELWGNFALGEKLAGEGNRAFGIHPIDGREVTPDDCPQRLVELLRVFFGRLRLVQLQDGLVECLDFREGKICHVVLRLRGLPRRMHLPGAANSSGALE